MQLTTHDFLLVKDPQAIGDLAYWKLVTRTGRCESYSVDSDWIQQNMPVNIIHLRKVRCFCGLIVWKDGLISVWNMLIRWKWTDMKQFGQIRIFLSISSYLYLSIMGKYKFFLVFQNRQISTIKNITEN